ncbi:MAG: lamin tail domain-containing protein [Candidatus Sumerlaeia bacterium]|nr:lamin tail domain-containing protein [Candidatus Sumerlaeia bacterium]
MIYDKNVYVAAALALFSPVFLHAFDPWAGDLSKSHPDDIRVMSYNVYNLFPAGTQEEFDAHARILRAVEPDIISYQEMDPGIAPVLREHLGDILGGTWQTHESITDGVNVNILASRWGIGQRRQDTSPSSSTRGVAMGLVNLPNDRYPVNMYVMGVHFSCCSGEIRDIRRQRHADALASWMGRARNPGGLITLPHGTPMIVVGDVNFNASANPQSRLTLMTGDIQDVETFGPPIKPDWDESNLDEALPLDPYTMRFQTFNAFTPAPWSFLDRFYYTDSVLDISQGFILNTLTIPEDLLPVLDLQRNDTAIASDHLPVIVDFSLRSMENNLPRHGDVYLTEIQPFPSVVSTSDGKWFEIYNRTSAPIDMNGWVLGNSSGVYSVIRSEGPTLIRPRSHFVFGWNDSVGENGGVPVDYVLGSDFTLTSGADSIVLYRGSVKIDGVRYNGGPQGFRPASHDAGQIGPRHARAMTGDYRRGRTNQWAPATTPYNEQDRGTPGGWNDGSIRPEPSNWVVH